MFEDIIKHYPDFPKPGIDFIDILPFLHDKKEYVKLIKAIEDATTTPNIATVEARGFLFAPALLATSEKIDKIVTIRKKGKLPYGPDDLRQVDIMKEYGSDSVFYRLSDIAACEPEGDTIFLTLFDDILATGGTAAGIAKALNGETVVKNGREYKVKVKEFVFLVELASEIPGAAAKLEEIAPVRSIIIL